MLTSSKVRVIYQEENGCIKKAKMDEKRKIGTGRPNFYQYWSLLACVVLQ